LPDAYNRARPSEGFPEPLRKEQGSRAFGEAVSPLFPWYFGIQGACGVLAAATALTFVRTRGWVHRIRAVLLLAALVTVGIGVWLERTVEGLRGPRNRATDAVLMSSSPTSDEISQADAARADFIHWHGYSLSLNMITLLLVTLAMAMVGALPPSFTATRPHEGMETTNTVVSPPHQLTTSPTG
jgi:hypothetical protein